MSKVFEVAFSYTVLALVLFIFLVWVLMLPTHKEDTDKQMRELYKNYHALTMYEDGSVMGKTVDGKEFAYCIKGAMCDTIK